MNKLQEMLDRIQKEAPEELQQVHDDFIKKGYDREPDKSPVFEIDDEIRSVPFRKLREYLQSGKVTEPSLSQVPAFRNRIPLPSSTKTEFKHSRSYDAPKDEGYYWDDNYNYEYMNPESEKNRVLGKVKK